MKVQQEVARHPAVSSKRLPLSASRQRPGIAPFCGFKAGRENSCRLASAQFVAVPDLLRRNSCPCQIIGHLLDSPHTLIRETTLWVLGFAFARSMLNQVNVHRHFPFVSFKRYCSTLSGCYFGRSRKR